METSEGLLRRSARHLSFVSAGREKILTRRRLERLDKATRAASAIGSQVD